MIYLQAAKLYVWSHGRQEFRGHGHVNRQQFGTYQQVKFTRLNYVHVQTIQLQMTFLFLSNMQLVSAQINACHLCESTDSCVRSCIRRCFALVHCVPFQVQDHDARQTARDAACL